MNPPKTHSLLIESGVSIPRNLKRVDPEDPSRLNNAAFGVKVMKANAPIKVATTAQ